MRAGRQVDVSRDEVLQGYERRLFGLGLARATVGIYLILARNLLAFAGARPIDETLATSYREEVAPTVGTNTWISYVHGLNSFLAYLGAEARFEPPRKVRKEAEPLSKDEFLRLLRAAESQEDPVLAARDKAILLLLGEGAARAGEIRGLRTEDLDLERGTIIARRPKGRHDRKIFLGSESPRALGEYLRVRGPARGQEDEEHLFLNLWGRRIEGRNTVLQVVYRLSRQAGLGRRAHPHMFRHMRITELSRQGMGPFRLQRFAGHEDLGTTLSYVHLDDDELREAVRLRPLTGGADPQVGKWDADLLIRALVRRLAAGEIGEMSFNSAISALEQGRRWTPPPKR